MRTLSGDHERFETTYFKVYPGYYFTGDGCRRDADGYYWLIGEGPIPQQALGKAITRLARASSHPSDSMSLTSQDNETILCQSSVIVKEVFLEWDIGLPNYSQQCLL